MAGQNIKINVDVNSNGTTERETKRAGGLKAAYDAAAKSAAGIGGTAGSRGVAAGMQPVAAQVRDYGTQRGSAGMTGASSRDFANQAQGLGGLVRLYATYAANVFAVGAAFRALSTAMDTTNMVRGLDQIGATSGVALGGLSKQLVAATGGAISLREAMSATVKVTAAGLGTENVLRLGTVAAKASQALGVDMTDAVSRLSRGITKLEPELLDELGIFTKIDPAVEQYSLRVGKAASQLTDFERRQAFANAVLEEGEKKFAAIKVDANPYNKLAATFKDVTQNVLELVNVGLTPLVNILSSSPTALTAILAVVGTRLVKQAIPAVADYRNALDSAAESSKELATKRLQELKSSSGAEISERIKSLDFLAETEVAKADANAKRLADIKAASNKGISKRAIDISKKTMQDINDNDLAYLQKLVDKKSKLSPIYESLIGNIKTYTAVEKEQLAAMAQRNIILDKQAPLWTAAGQNEARYHNEMNAARKRSMTSQAAYTASTKGLFAGLKQSLGAYSESRQAIVTQIPVLDAAGVATIGTITTTTKGLGRLSASLQVAKLSFISFAAAAATAVSALMPWLQIIGLVVTAGGLLIGWMSKTKDESEKTKQAFTGIDESLKNLGNTVEVINKKPVLEQFNPQSIQSKATAISGLADNLRMGFESAFKEIDKMGKVDRLVNWVSKLWSGDVESNLSERISKGIAQVFSNIDENSETGKKAQQTILDIFKVDGKNLIDPKSLTSAEELEKAFDKLGTSARKLGFDVATRTIKDLGNQSLVSASKLTELEAAFKKVEEDRKKAINEFIPQDTISQLGSSLVSAYSKLDVALKDPEQRLAAIVQLSKDFVKVPTTDTGLSLQLMNIGKQAEEAQLAGKRVLGLQKELEKTQKEADLQRLKISAKPYARGQAFIPREDFAGNQYIDEEQLKLAELEASITRIRSQTRDAIQIKTRLTLEIDAQEAAINKAQLQVFETGARLVSSKLAAEFVKADVTIKNAVASVLGDTKIGIQMRADAEKRVISAQIEAVKAARDNTIAVHKNTIAREIANTLDKQIILGKMEGPLSPEQILERDVVNPKRLAELDTRSKQMEQASSGKGLATISGVKALVGTEQYSEELFNFAKSMEATNAALANYAAQLTAVDITKINNDVKLKYKLENETLDIQLKQIANRKELLTANKDIASDTNTSFVLTRQALEQEELSLQNKKENLTIEGKIEEFSKVKEKAAEKDKEGIQDQIVRLNELKSVSNQIYSDKTIRKELTDRLEIINTEYKQRVKQFEEEQVSLSRSLELRAQELDYSGKLLEVKKSNNEITELDYISQKALQETQQARLKLEQDITAAKKAQQTALAEIDRQEAGITATLNQRQQFAPELALGPTAAETQKLGELAAERQKVNATYTASESSAQRLLSYTTDITNKTKEGQLYQQQWNDLMKNMQGLAEALTGAFGNIGTALGEIGTTFLETAKKQQEYDQQIITAKQSQRDIIADIVNLEQAPQSEQRDSALETRNKALETASKSEKKAIQEKEKLELAANAKMLASTKKLFSEKTAAFKIISAFEKAMHIQKVAMAFKEIVVDKLLVTSKVTSEGEMYAVEQAGFLARAPTMVTSIFGKITEQLGVYGPVVAAGIVAAIGLSAWSKGGKSSTGPTAADRQEVQGSAMGYDAQGNKSQFTRGKLGDPTAKSTLLEDTMSLLTQSSVDNLDVNNKQLEALRKIEAGIRGAVAGIYNISGLASGSRFGTQEGTSGSSFLGLFGSSKTREIVDSGLQFSGSLQELATSSSSLVSAFETVRTSSTRSILGFKKRGVQDSTEIQQLGETDPQSRRLANFLNKTFDGAIDFITETASAAGYGAEIAEALTQDLPEQLRTFSTRGLKPEEMGQAFQAWLGSVMNVYGEEIFKADFDEFAQGGEEITATVARVLQQNKILNQSFKNLGFEDLTSRVRALPENLNKTNTEITVAVGRISQQMIDLAGGLDKFSERENLIASKFLTAGQRTEIARNKLTEEIGKLGGLRDLGIDTTAVKTREDYVKVIDQLNDAVVRGVPGADKLQNSWKNLAGLFDQTLPEFDNSIDQLITTLSKSKDKIADIAKEIQKLQRPGYDAGNAFWQLSDSLATMYQQLVAADKVTRENVEALIALTEAQINLLTVQNERKAQEQLTALETEIATKNLKGFAQTVANIAKRMEEFTRNLVLMGQATDANIARTRNAARALYDTAAAEAARSADLILQGLSTQTASLGLSQLSREIQGITNTFVTAAQQLADLGQLTQGAIAELMSGATAQIEFAQQQNQQQATAILSSFAQETANQGLTQFAQQIQGIRDKARGVIQQLAQLGQATEENIANIISLAQSQADFVAAQNARQAQELIIAKNTELLTKNLGPFGQELLAIAQQAQDTVKQLVDLGQATDENIAAVRRWQDTMVESARLARLSAQEQQYAEIFASNAVSGVAAKFRSLGFTLPGTVDQFKQLIDAIDTTSVAGIDLRGKLLDLGSEFTSLIEQTSSALRAAYDDRVGELSSAKEQFEGFADSLRDFKKSLLTGSLTPLTPQQQYEINRQEFLQVSQRAQGGDVKAIQQLQSASSSFLESSRTMFASSEAYSQDFGLVTSALDNTTTFAEMQIEIANNTLAEIKNVVGALIDLSDITENGDVILTGIGAKLEKTIADYTQLTNNTNIDLSRFEATSANQRNALLEASLFVEDQIRGGINQVAGLIDLGTNIALGNVALGITNMSTEVSGAIEDLQTRITEIADEQLAPGFNQIDEAITTALTDENNPTAAAIRDLTEQYKTMRTAYETREGSINTAITNLGTSFNNLAAAITKPPEIITRVVAAEPTAAPVLPWWYYDDTTQGGAASPNAGYAKGTNYVPQDMMALIHAGERIIPAADNKRLMNFLDQTATDGSLTQQIEKLQKTILQLEQTVAQGSVINAEATNRNTEVIAETISDTQRERQYLRKIQDRNAIV